MGVLKTLGGVALILLGLGIAGWIGWAMVNGDGPRRAFRGIGFGLFLAVVGVGLLFGASNDGDADTD